MPYFKDMVNVSKSVFSIFYEYTFRLILILTKWSGISFEKLIEEIRPQPSDSKNS